jgi:hypothetical protein
MTIQEFVFVDFKDISNWICLAIAIPLLIWGIRMMLK